MAAAVKNPTRIDDHARGVHFTGDDALCFNLDSTLGKNHTVKPPSDNHAIAFDLSFDPSAFTENHSLFGDDVSLDATVDAECALKLERALQRNALVNETRPLFAATVR